MRNCRVAVERRTWGWHKVEERRGQTPSAREEALPDERENQKRSVDPITALEGRGQTKEKGCLPEEGAHAEGFVQGQAASR